MRLLRHLFLRRRRWGALLPFLLGALLPVGTVSQAQAQTPQHVIVTLRDAANRGLDQVVVTLRTLDGDMLAEGVTDRDGIVRLMPPASVDALRVNVCGIAASGTPLQLAASERDGIVVRLLGAKTTITLRVEDDGTVLPDPATMAEAVGVPPTSPSTGQTPISATSIADVTMLPTAAALPSPAEASTAYPQQPAPAEFVDADGQPVTEQPSSPSRTGLFLLMLLLGLGCIVTGVWRLVSRRGGQR